MFWRLLIVTAQLLNCLRERNKRGGEREREWDEEREREVGGRKREKGRGEERCGERSGVCAAGEHGLFSVDCGRISPLTVIRIFKGQACGLM